MSDLVAISLVTGYSILWLATGKGPPRSSERVEDERGENRLGGTNLNKELLTAVIAAVEEYLDGAEVTTDKKATLIVAAYEMSEDDGRIDRQRVLRLVQLVK